MSEVKHRRRAAHRVRQGRRPPHPPRRQGARRPLRPRHRPGAHLAAGPRPDAGAQDRQRAAHHRARWRRPARAAEGRPARPDQGLHRARRPGRSSAAARRSSSRSPSTSSATPRRRRWSPPSTTTLSVEAEATHIPTGFEVVRRRAQRRHQIHAKDLQLPTGVTLVTDPEALIVNVTAAQTAEQLEAELAEAEAEVGIEHEPTDEEQAAEAEAAPRVRLARAAEGGARPARATRPTAEPRSAATLGRRTGRERRDERRRLAGRRARQPRARLLR